MRAVITADLVHSTSLSSIQRAWVNNRTSELLKGMCDAYLMRYEQYRGDSFQCLMPTKEGLKVALLIKTEMKSLQTNLPIEKDMEHNHKLDVRVSLALGDVEMETEKLGTSDGEAFRLSGKRLDGMKKEKRTFCISTKDNFERELELEGHLMDTLLSKATPLQSEVIVEKIYGRSEKWIAEKLKINQSAVNQRASSAGWGAIEKMIQRFEEMYGNDNRPLLF